MCFPAQSPVYLNSTSGLTSRLNDYVYVYIIPIICLLGLSVNCLNTLVLYQRRVRSQQLFANYLMIAVADCVWLFFGLSSFAFRCGLLCSFGYSFGAKIYELYIFMLIGSICATFKSIILITIAFTTLVVILERNYHLGDLLTTKSKCVICAILSILLNVVVIAITNIVVPFTTLRSLESERDNYSVTRLSVIYTIQMRDNIEKYDIILKSLMLCKDPVLYLTLFVMFMVISLKLVIRIQRKEVVWRREGSMVFFKETQTIQTKENKQTLMTLCVLLAFLIGHSVSSGFFLTAEFLSRETYQSLCDYLALKDVLIFASSSVNFFLFYRFNLVYKRAFRSIRQKFHPRNIIWRPKSGAANMNSVRARLSSYPKPTCGLIEAPAASPSSPRSPPSSPRAPVAAACSVETEASRDMMAMETSQFQQQLDNESISIEFVCLEKINDSVIV